MTSESSDRVNVLISKAVEVGVPSAEVERWLRAFRPCALLEPDGAGPVAVQLGGHPVLPLDAPDPSFPFIASLDCAALSREATDLALPSDGHLLFFADPDGMDDEGEVMYVPAGTAAEQRQVGYVLPGRLLRPTVSLSPPGDAVPTDVFPHDVELFETWGQTSDARAFPASFQVGGYPLISNNEEPSLLAAAEPVSSVGADPEAAQRDWVLLASWNAHQVEEVLDRVTVHWVIPREDLAALRFDRVRAIADVDE